MGYGCYQRMGQSHRVSESEQVEEASPMWEQSDIQSQRLIKVKSVSTQIEELPGVGISLREGWKDTAVLMGNWVLSTLKTMAARVLPLGDRKYNYEKSGKTEGTLWSLSIGVNSWSSIYKNKNLNVDVNVCIYLPHIYSLPLSTENTWEQKHHISNELI